MRPNAPPTARQRTYVTHNLPPSAVADVVHTEAVSGRQTAAISNWQDDHGLVLLFEQGGFVYAYRSCDEAAGSVESMDVVDGHCVGAFSDRGEVIAVGQGDLFASFTPTGRFDHAGLRLLIEHSRGPRHLGNDPQAFAPRRS